MEENNILKYEDYKEQFLWTFEKERLECCFYDLYKKVLKSKIGDSDIINVSKNKKEQAKKYIDEYNGKVPDLIVVPKSYTYDKPVKQILNFESKIPNMDITKKCINRNNCIKATTPDSESKIPNMDFEDECTKRYNCIKVATQSDYDEIDANTKICPYLILTDGLTWYIIKKDKNNSYEKTNEQGNFFTFVRETKFEGKRISLVEPAVNAKNKKYWKWAAQEVWGNLLDEIENIYKLAKEEYDKSAKKEYDKSAKEKYEDQAD